MFQEAKVSTVKQHNPSPKIMTFCFSVLLPQGGGNSSKVWVGVCLQIKQYPDTHAAQYQYSSGTLNYWQNYTQTFDQISSFVEKSSRQSCILKLDLQVNWGKCYRGGKRETGSYHVSTKFTTSGVARAFLGGPAAHPENQNEEENE